MSTVSASPVFQQPRHIRAARPIEGHAGSTRGLFRNSLEGCGLVADLDEELLLVAFEIDPMSVGDNQHCAANNLGFRTDLRNGQSLSDVRERILPRASMGATWTDRQREQQGKATVSQGQPLSFDLNGHHAQNAPAPQEASCNARPAYDWSLDRPGAAFQIEPISDTIPADLDPNLSPAMVPLQIRLAATRPARLELMRASLLGIAVTAGLIGLCAATITAATIRMPEVIQASVDAEGV